MLKSHLRDLVALRLDNCPRLTVNGLFNCVRQKNMPSLVRLHAYWFDEGDIAADVELWKAFAASEDIKADAEQEGLVWITMLKEVPLPNLRADLPAQPPAVHMPHAGVRYLAPPAAAVPPGSSSGSTSSSSSRHRHKKHQGGSRRGRRRRSAHFDSSDDDSSDDEDSSSGSSSGSDSSEEYHSSRSHRSRSPAGSSHRRRRRKHR